MNPSIEEYAERVWRGEAHDSIAHPSQLGGDVMDVLDGVGLYRGFGNTIVLRADGELVLFDTSYPFTGPEMYESVRAWDRSPVRTAIFSHGHLDHVSGMGGFDAEPGIRPTVIAHERVGDRFDRYLLTRGYNTMINRRQFDSATLEWPTEFRRPDLTYRDAMSLTCGGLDIELFHVKGETDDATVAWLPRLRLLCPGDMFIWLAPNCGNPQKVQRYPREWAHALRRMAALGAETMLPSHGAPIFGADRIRQALLDTARWLESLVEQALAGINAGARLDELVREVHPPADLADRVYLRAKYDEPEFVVRAIWRQYAGWYDGNPAHLKPAPEAELATAIARLAGGPGALAQAATSHLSAGEYRLAGHFAELAVLAAPDDARFHRVRGLVYKARAEHEESLMARGIFADAAKQSARVEHAAATQPARQDGAAT